MSWRKPAPTITGGCINPSKGRFLHPEEDRSITLREAALLQGFPKSYRFAMEKGATSGSAINRQCLSLPSLLSVTQNPSVGIWKNTRGQTCRVGLQENLDCVRLAASHKLVFLCAMGCVRLSSNLAESAKPCSSQVRTAIGSV